MNCRFCPNSIERDPASGASASFRHHRACKDSLRRHRYAELFHAARVHGEVSKAREIVPNVNRMAAALRARGGHVVWVKNATNGTRESWSVMHDCLMTLHNAICAMPPWISRTKDTHCGRSSTQHPEDGQIVKNRQPLLLTARRIFRLICASAASIRC